MQVRAYRYLIVFLACSLVLSGWFWTRRAQAANFVVNSNGDASDANPGDGVCATSTGVCTLRAAIQESNALAGTDIITFDLGGGGSVSPASGLPFITSPVIIDGQTGGTRRVQLIGTNAGSAYGLVLGTGSGGSQISSLVIRNFSIDGLVVGSNGNTIRDCYIGTDFFGTVKQANGNDGIRIDGSNNTIGGTTASAGNVISGNNRYGVHIDLTTAQGNQIQGNYIGTDNTGAADLGNGNSGIVVRGPFNTIGGNSEARNIISGNDQFGVDIEGSLASNNFVQGNYIGTNATGTTAIGNSFGGVLITDAPFNTIGGTTGSAGNLISGNTSIGLWLTRSGHNVIQGNLIGTDKTGTLPLPNGADAGVIVGDSANNMIGGTGAGTRNVISGNSGSGVLISGVASTGNNLQGNYIGTNTAGAAAIGNGNNGVTVGNSAANNTVGGTTAGAGNVISGNKVEGVFFTQGSNNNLVQGNYIGTNAVGSAAIGNGQNGVKILGSPNITVGGLAAGARNIISGNGSDGVLVNSDGMNPTKVQGNYIGTDATGTVALGNGAAGVALFTANNIVGGTTLQARNVISGNGREGIYITAIGNYVQGNFIGTNAAGTAALGNGLDGVKMDGAPSAFIGGDDDDDGAADGVVRARNIISGNGNSNNFIGNGVTISGGGATNNIVQGNFIGTDVNGTTALKNGAHGIYVAAAGNNIIGGTSAGARNIISGNRGVGVFISGTSASNNQVQGNFIGANVNGTAALGNSGNGVRIDAPNNLLGGTAPGAGNVISGNAQNGVSIVFPGATGNLLQGNLIGTNAAGTGVLGNSFDGVQIAEANNTVGGTVQGAANVISGNGIYGVDIRAANGCVVQGNFIGTDITGTLALGNLNHGVYVSGSGNGVGGTATGASNVIAFNTGNGATIASGTGNSILRNSIFANGKLGIDLNGDGVTPNDAGDADTGPNKLQNFPVLTSARSNAPNGTTNVQGTINSTANTNFTIQFFSSSAADPSGYGEGQTFRGSTTVTTDAAGNATFSVNLPIIASGHAVAATATDPSNNTSEFSQALAVDVFTISGRITNSQDSTGLQGVTVSLTGSQTATTQTDSNGNYSFTAQAGGNYTITPSLTNFTFSPPSQSFSNLSGNSVANFAGTSATPTPTPTPTPNVVQFSASNYNVQEDCTTVTITVNRSGDTSAPATVDYQTSDVTATERKDYITALGKLQFGAGESSKSFAVLINEDSFVEGNETFNINLTNPVGVTLGGPAIATVTIIDDPSEPSANVIDDPQNYVCQHYHDFLNRQPDQAGWDFWTNQITSCGADAQCIEIRRINVSASFFLSIEFQDTGYLVERIYKVAYGDTSGNSTFPSAHQLPVPVVRLNEFLSDTQKISNGVIVGQGNWQQQIEDNKQAFAAEFVQRSRFLAAYPTSLTAAQFVDQLNVNAGNPLSQSERDQLVNDLSTNAKTRAQVLRAVAEDTDLKTAEFNRAFVLMQYFGYLRRNPNDPQDTDYTGYDFWLTKLNQFNGNYLDAEMVKAFITSIEYRQRFGP